MPARDPTPANPPGPGKPLNVRAELRRTHAAVLFFYLVDAVLLGVLGASGTVPPALCVAYAVAGIVVTEALYFVFRRRGGRVEDLETLALGLTASSGLLMLATLAAAPRVGGLMLMSMMAVLALSAVQLTRRHQFTLCLLLAGGSVLALAATGGSAGVPTGTLTEQVVSALWLAWLMAKGSAHNIAGTRLRGQVNRANAELAKALQTLEKVAATDELTLLPNRREILARVQRAVAGEPTPGASSAPVAIALLDIDRFKLINDSRGHEVGDAVLREFGRVLALGLRPADQVGRYGGEEFLLVLPGCDSAKAATEVVERLCASVRAHDWARISPGLAVTASVGVTLLMPGEDGAAAIRRADTALYQAKDGGRDRVVVAAAPPSPPHVATSDRLSADVH